MLELMVTEEENKNYQCKNCGRQFIKSYEEIGYPQKVKKNCLTIYPLYFA